MQTMIKDIENVGATPEFQQTMLKSNGNVDRDTKGFQQKISNTFSIVW